MPYSHRAAHRRRKRQPKCPASTIAKERPPARLWTGEVNRDSNRIADKVDLDVFGAGVASLKKLAADLKDPRLALTLPRRPSLARNESSGSR